MKKLIKYVFALLLFVVVLVVVMFVFKICPPKGPWPTPPWCGSGEFTQIEYEVNVQPGKLSQIRAVNMVDTWGRNYNMGMVENTQANIESSFDRVKGLGAEEVYVHDFHRAIYPDGTDFKSLNYTIEDEIFLNDFRDQSISEEELKKLADVAHERGLKIGIKHNMSFVNIGKYIINGLEGTIQENVEKDARELDAAITEEWTKDYFAKWQNRMVAKAAVYQRAGIDSMSISPSFMSVNFAGYEDLVNDLYKTLIKEVRKEFSGKIYAEMNVYGLLDGYLQKEDWSKYDYYKDADIREVRVYSLPEKFRKEENPSREQLALSMDTFVQELNEKAKEKGVKFSVFFAPSSYQNAINKGPVEIYDANNALVKSLPVNFEQQVDSFQTMFESLLKADNIERINVGNFAWDDALDPEVTPRISIAATFRNKPAEEVVKAWFSVAK